jgi:dTDP-4-amino-4,6-dideoxygalactose transaminase
MLENKNIRNPLIDKMAKMGIELRKMIYPVYYSKPYVSIGDKKTYPIAEKISLNSFHLPSSTGLKDKEILYIVASLKRALKEVLKNKVR